MKVVINNCFGGFKISNEALLLLIKRKSSIVKKMTIQHFYGGSDEYKNWKGKGKPAPCYNPKWRKKYNENKEEFTFFKEGFLKDRWFDGTLYKGKYVYTLKMFDTKIRSHPDLIWVIQKLGKKANGPCAKLKIVEIPDGTDYTIEEYDGIEHIAEAHETWS